MRRRHKQAVGIIVVAALVAGAAAWTYVRYRQASSPGAPAVRAEGESSIPAPAPGEAPIELSLQTPASQPASSPANAPDADAQLRKGRELLQAGKLLEARSMLSDLLFSGALDPAQQKQAVQDLTLLAEQTIFCPRIVGDDPCAMQYTLRSGDNLTAVERRLALHVPTQILVKINNLPSASSLRAGQTIKVIQGPVHAVVSKSRFTMDLYLQREGGPKVFLLRVPVGLGRDDTTPLGRFGVQLGQKLTNATWNPPPSSGRSGALRPGDSGYPLGKAGYWIGLVGLDPATAACQGYGIHGTNDPQSIGANASLGCIRLDDFNIEMVFGLLYEKWSTVTIVP